MVAEREHWNHMLSEIHSPLKRLVVRIDGEVRRPVGWRRFFRPTAQAELAERPCWVLPSSIVARRPEALPEYEN